jgi:phospholipid-binding lipoprotein MlaA
MFASLRGHAPTGALPTLVIMQTNPPVFLLTLWLMMSLTLSACATTGPRGGDAGASPAGGQVADDNNDPLEPFNRAMYTFNDTLDRYVLKPVAKGYRAVLPSPVRKGVSNFFGNLHEPAVMVNSALQGKFSQAASDLSRFILNTAFGVFGLFDVATALGVERHNEDFGQTLGKWGVGEGPYLVLPILGPSNFRDAPGLYVDNELYPPSHLNSSRTRAEFYVTEAVDTRARLLDAGDILDQAAGEDPYVFVREAYRQRRRSLIGDGANATPAPLDPSIFEEDETAPKPQAAPKPAKSQ